jgi:hypothetical protein
MTQKKSSVSVCLETALYVAEDSHGDPRGVHNIEWAKKFDPSRLPSRRLWGVYQVPDPATARPNHQMLCQLHNLLSSGLISMLEKMGAEVGKYYVLHRAYRHSLESPATWIKVLCVLLHGDYRSELYGSNVAILAINATNGSEILHTSECTKVQLLQVPGTAFCQVIWSTTPPAQ